MKTAPSIKGFDVNSLKDALESKSEILFAYLFGSFSMGKETSFSDIDVAIFYQKEIPLLELGRLTAELESLTVRNVDLIVLNNLYKKDPGLAFEIVARGVLLVTKDTKKLQEYKTKSILYYADTAPLRKQVETALLSRLDSGNFARSHLD